MTTTLASDRPAASAESRASNRNSEVDWRGTELPQHMQALEKANQVRFAIAAHKKTIRAGGTQAEGFAVLADLIEDPAAPIARASLGQMLACVPWVRARQAERLVVRMGLPMTVLRKQIGPCPRSKDRTPLTDRQRALVVECLRKNAERLRNR